MLENAHLERKRHDSKWAKYLGGGSPRGTATIKVFDHGGNPRKSLDVGCVVIWYVRLEGISPLRKSAGNPSITAASTLCRCLYTSA
jgi:hypothetical protein